MKKLLAVGVIVLFLGLAIAPSTGTVIEQSHIICNSNNPPYEPCFPIPPNGTTDVFPTCLEWTGGDPDGDNVTYFFDWGDDTNSDWTGYVPSGIQVNESHTWSKKGTYEIKVKAQDVYGAESEWAYLEVTMPKSKPFNFNLPLISWLLERFPILNQIVNLLMEKWI